MRPIKWRAPRWVWVEFEGQIAFPYGSSLEPLEMWFDQERSYLKLFFSHNSFGAKHVTVAPTKVNPSLSKDTPTCDSMLAWFARLGLLGLLSGPDHLDLDCSVRSRDRIISVWTARTVWLIRVYATHLDRLLGPAMRTGFRINVSDQSVQARKTFTSD